MLKVYDYNGLHYVRVTELTPIEQEIVQLEMVGSTCPVIPGENPIGCIYLHDYFRIEWHMKKCTPIYKKAEHALLSKSVRDVTTTGDSLGI